MMRRRFSLAGLFGLLWLLPGAAPQALPDGHFLTPTAAPGANLQTLDPHLGRYPGFRPGQALNCVLSPDGTMLAVLTSGFNDLAIADPAFGRVGAPDLAHSTEYLFLYRVGGRDAARPLPIQVLKVPESFAGLAFAPGGGALYVSGGADDAVTVYARGPGGFGLSGRIGLGHRPPADRGLGKRLYGGLGFRQDAVVSNLAVSADGRVLLAANSFNASVSVIDPAARRVLAEYDLRPFHTDPAHGQGVAGGEIPFAVAIAGGRAYVGSLRDRDITVLDLADPARPRFVGRIGLPGTPLSILADDPVRPGRIFVAMDNADAVAEIDPASLRVRQEIDAAAPPGLIPNPARLTGAAPNHLALSPDRRTLYVTNGGQNAVAVIPLADGGASRVAGLIPTGWYPHALTVSADGKFLYVVNGRSDPGANPAHWSSATAHLRTMAPDRAAAAAAAARGANQYILQLEQAGLLAVPVPDARTLSRLSRQVADNDRYGRVLPDRAEATMRALRRRIRHVIYIVKENRTFDQVLGDLDNGSDGDPALAMFGARITPNLHRAARNFVTFDRFFDASEVSGDGWMWTTAARETDVNVKFIPLAYGRAPDPDAQNHGRRGAPYDAEGQNSGVDVGIATLGGREAAEPGYAADADRLAGGAANLLPGTASDTAPDGPDGAVQQGWLWNAAARAGIPMRNYGFYVDLTPDYPNIADPFARRAIEAYPTDPTLAPVTDPYFRSFDNRYPDYWRYLEWRREFDQYVAHGTLPRLIFLRYMHDHMGNFDTAAAGLTYPEAQQADDDDAVGLTLEAVAHSRYATDTLVLVVEDDAQDGPDHVSAHRSTAYMVGPYVRHHAIDHHRYTQVDLIRTIEDLLGLAPLNLNDSWASPMWTAFDLSRKHWDFTARASAYLRDTGLLPAGTRYADAEAARPAHGPAYWTRMTQGFDWSDADRAPAGQFNRVLWAGLEAGRPYPPPPVPPPPGAN